MGEVTRMEMEFLYFETWGNEACSLDIYSVVFGIFGCASKCRSVAPFVLILAILFYKITFYFPLTILLILLKILYS